MSYIILYALILLYTFILANGQLTNCGDWQSYNDEKCFKVMDSNSLNSYDDAKFICNRLGSSLISIRSQSEQEFLFNLLYNVYNMVNNVWLGIEFKSNTYKWLDSIALNYTNWANGYPINQSSFDCVQMALNEPYNNGKWFNKPCNKKNVVLCEKMQYWLAPYVQKTVIELRETVYKITIQMKRTESEFVNITKQFERTKSELQTEIRKSTPVGAIAYFSKSTPPIGWLKANGQSVSRNTYANLFATIGTTFGSGDGSTTFTLPDLRGEFIRGWSDARDVDKFRAFGSFQWGSNIPLASQINGSWLNAGAVGYQSRWSFAGNTFDDGFEYNVPSGQTRDGTKFPDSNEIWGNEMYYINAPNRGFVNNWNVLKGTRPRNIALLACIKY